LKLPKGLLCKKAAGSRHLNLAAPEWTADWSEGVARIGDERVKLQIAHFKLSHTT
jgi:hypothetical protein